MRPGGAREGGWDLTLAPPLLRDRWPLDGARIAYSPNFPSASGVVVRPRSPQTHPPSKKGYTARDGNTAEKSFSGGFSLRLSYLCGVSFLSGLGWGRNRQTWGRTGMVEDFASVRKVRRIGYSRSVQRPIEAAGAEVPTQDPSPLLAPLQGAPFYDTFC